MAITQGSYGQSMDYTVDMVFCIDATGSMEDFSGKQTKIINMVKQNAISFYEFVEEQKIRKSIYSVGDENKYFHEILIPYVYAFGGEALLNKIMPYVTEQFHFY